MKYHAKSLEDVAKAFEEFGLRARKQSNDLGITKKQSTVLLSEWSTWFAAADFIRNTQLED